MALPKERIGISLRELLKATMAGGLLFLLPVALIAIVLKHAMQLVGKIVTPISNYLPVEAVVGVWGETVLAALVLILVSLIAGLVARTNVGRRIMRWFENSLLGGLPQYQLVKSMAEGLAHVESAEGVDPALVSIEGGWQIGYLLEPLENGWVAVFLPQAAYSYVGKRDVPARGSGTAIGHHDRPSHGARKAYRSRISRSSAQH